MEVQPGLSQKFVAQVRDLSNQGLGVVNHPDGRVFFAMGVWPGDEGEFEILQSERRYGFARLSRLLVSSQDRKDSECQYQGFESGKCGGCPWMIGSYSSQLAFKEKRLKHTLERFHLLHSETQFHPIWPSETPLGYRSRVQFKTDGQRIGYVSPQTKTLVEVQDCVALTDKLREKLKQVWSLLPNPQWAPSKGYLWNFLELNEKSDVTDLSLNHKLPFEQTHIAQNLRMRAWLKQKLMDHSQKEEILELFCGSGNFTDVIVQAGFDQIAACDVSPSSLEELKRRHPHRVKTVLADLFSKRFISQLREKVLNPTVLVLDPPREGFFQLGFLVKQMPSVQKIYSVSCDEHRMAQDFRKLVENGQWRLTEVQSVDQFPQTPHLEILTVWTRT